MRVSLTDQGKSQDSLTNTALSLVATLFLPQTFLAGVFGETKAIIKSHHTSEMNHFKYPSLPPPSLSPFSF
jgi:hypothetical protein